MCPVGDDVPAERLRPRGDQPVQKPVLHVNERGQLRVTGRHDAAGDVRRSQRELPLVELVGGDVVGERRVLELGVKRRFPTVDPEIPRVLDRRQFVWCLPLRPRHSAAGVHRGLPLPVELVGRAGAGAVPLTFTPQLGVLTPIVFGVRPLVDELRPFALPGRVLLPVEQPVGQIVGADDGDGAEAGDPLAGAGEAEDGPGESSLAGGALRGARGRLVGLRIVDQHEVRPNRLAVGPGVPEPADAAGDAGDTDGGTGRRPAGDRRERYLIGTPLDLRRLSFAELTTCPLVDSLERPDRIGRLRVVVGQEVVLLEVALDRIEHLLGDRLIGADQRDELPVTVQQRPEACPLAEGGLAGAARHGEGEQLAAKHRRFDLGDRGQMVGRPRQRERLGGVRLAEEAEVQPAGIPAGRIDDCRRRADVAAGG